MLLMKAGDQQFLMCALRILLHMLTDKEWSEDQPAIQTRLIKGPSLSLSATSWAATMQSSLHTSVYSNNVFINMMRNIVTQSTAHRCLISRLSDRLKISFLNKISRLTLAS